LLFELKLQWASLLGSQLGNPNRRNEINKVKAMNYNETIAKALTFKESTSYKVNWWEIPPTFITLFLKYSSPAYKERKYSA